MQNTIYLWIGSQTCGNYINDEFLGYSANQYDNLDDEMFIIKHGQKYENLRSVKVSMRNMHEGQQPIAAFTKRRDSKDGKTWNRLKCEGVFYSEHEAMKHLYTFTGWGILSICVRKLDTCLDEILTLKTQN